MPSPQKIPNSESSNRQNADSSNRQNADSSNGFRNSSNIDTIGISPAGPSDAISDDSLTINEPDSFDIDLETWEGLTPEQRERLTRRLERDRRAIEDKEKLQQAADAYRSFVSGLVTCYVLGLICLYVYTTTTFLYITTFM